MSSENGSKPDETGERRVRDVDDISLETMIGDLTNVENPISFEVQAVLVAMRDNKFKAFGVIVEDLDVIDGLLEIDQAAQLARLLDGETELCERIKKEKAEAWEKIEPLLPTDQIEEEGTPEPTPEQRFDSFLQKTLSSEGGVYELFQKYLQRLGWMIDAEDHQALTKAHQLLESREKEKRKEGIDAMRLRMKAIIDRAVDSKSGFMVELLEPIEEGHETLGIIKSVRSSASGEGSTDVRGGSKFEQITKKVLAIPGSLTGKTLDSSGSGAQLQIAVGGIPAGTPGELYGVGGRINPELKQEWDTISKPYKNVYEALWEAEQKLSADSKKKGFDQEEELAAATKAREDMEAQIMKLGKDFVAKRASDFGSSENIYEIGPRRLILSSDALRKTPLFVYDHISGSDGEVRMSSFDRKQMTLDELKSFVHGLEVVSRLVEAKISEIEWQYSSSVPPVPFPDGGSPTAGPAVTLAPGTAEEGRTKEGEEAEKEKVPVEK